MKHTLIAILLIYNSIFLFSQVPLIIEGREIIDTETGVSNGYNIPRSQPTALTFRNNSLVSVNATGYMLQAGDEVPGSFNNNLRGAVITGNEFIWNGTDEGSTTHTLFTGYNVDVIIKYNYLYKSPNGIQRKSDGMTDNSGIVAYNIINDPKVGVVVKGMNGVKIYNNTFYSGNSPAQTWRGLIDIHANTDGGLNSMSTGVKVFNNIFYTKNSTFNIKIYEPDCLVGFESDYNVFWCEAGGPIFEIDGQSKTFAQWQALGYDLHSVVINPEFINFTDFIPRFRLDYGKDLGSDMQNGLAIDAQWSITGPPRTVSQNGTWQAGARIYEASGAGISIYPNPAYDFFYVKITDTDLTYQRIKIYDSNGRMIMEDSIVYGPNKIPIPEYFTTGVYSIALEADNLDRYVRKLIILN